MQSDNHQPKQANSRPVALVTGGAQRIGKSIVIALHGRGIDIAIHCHQSREHADQLAMQLNGQRTNSAIVLQQNLSNSQTTKKLIVQLVSHYGRLDYLVNNASIFYPVSMLDSEFETSMSQFCQINFETPVKLLTEAYPYLAKNNGSALNLIDIYARSGLTDHTAYVASKSALNQATKQLALEFSPQVRVNGISPGAILWPDAKTQTDLDENELSIQQTIIANTAVKRKGSAEDISAAAVFLLLDASYITGLTLAVDGGRQLYI